MNRLVKTGALALLLLGTVSCDKLLDVSDPNEVELDNTYNTFNDADNIILALYGRTMSLVDRLIILGELRGDLMEGTPNATFDMTDISNHSATESNTYCDVTPFYNVILTCNDALANFDRMKAENKLSPANYAYRYADVAALRCWIYLQLAIHFGQVPYVTDPLVSVEALSNKANFPMKTFDEMVNTLIECMEGLPTKDVSIASPLYGTTIDGYNMSLLFLNKKALLGDLYLWANRYTEAATMYYAVIDDAEKQLFSGNEKYAYKCDGWVWDASNEPQFQVCYGRYKGQDMNAYRNKWKEMFARTSTDGEIRREMITMWSYEPRFAPRYPLIDIFANTGDGKYQLRPTAYAIDSLWEAQIQRENNFPFDGRGRESSFDRAGGQPVVLKYLYFYYPYTTDDNKTMHLQYASPASDKEGSWFVYRAAVLHLRYAEAANRAGYPNLALALLNDGIRDHFNWDGRNNKEGIQYSGYKPATSSDASVPYPAPFYLDGRQNDLPYTYLRSPWRDNYGIRRRAWVQNVTITDTTVHTTQDSILFIEKMLLREDALELGFEGHRWGDLLRIALRRNKNGENGTELLNDIMMKAKGISGLVPEQTFLPYKK